MQPAARPIGAGPGDSQTWPKYNGQPGDPRGDGFAEWAEEQSEQAAKRALETDSLAALAIEHGEDALLDLLLDAHRYGGDTQAAFKDLMDGLKTSIAARVLANLQCERDRARSED